MLISIRGGLWLQGFPLVGFTVGSAGYVICPAKPEWQITLPCEPCLRFFRLILFDESIENKVLIIFAS